MKLFNIFQEAESYVAQTNTFAVSRLYSEQKNNESFHSHDYCEIYFSISGGRQFLINSTAYAAAEGDIFVIPPGELHWCQLQPATHYERYILLVSPEFLKEISVAQTNLHDLFINHISATNHRATTSKEHRSRIELLLRKISASYDFGGDLIEKASMIELLAIIGGIYMGDAADKKKGSHPVMSSHSGGALAYNLIRYIDSQITQPLQISVIASQFYISDSYACRIFKQEYGVTINKYIQDRRLSIAKSLLTQGFSVTETCEKSGFNDYTNFIKLFARTVGVTPKRFSMYNN